MESYRPALSRIDLQTGESRRSARWRARCRTASRFTDDGGVLVSCYRPDRILHLDARRQLEIVAEDPQGTLLAAPTNVVFAGPSLDRLVSANLGPLAPRADPHRAARRAARTTPTRWAADA